eukprot:scaffold172928_cov67-Attheya_sp.AAC.1
MGGSGLHSYGEAAVHNGLGVVLWSLQQGSKGCLAIQNVVIIGSLIGTGVKELQKLGPTKVKQELGIDTEFRGAIQRVIRKEEGPSGL